MANSFREPVSQDKRVALKDKVYHVEVIRASLRRLPSYARWPWMFIREVSQSGIGLVHNQSLDCGQVVLAIQDESGQAMELPTEILWCRPCENGLFISGGRFVTSAR